MPLVSCGKKTFPFLSLWRCWAAHYSCGYFNACGNTEKCTHRAPLWPPSLWNKNKINTLLGRDLTKAKGFLFLIFRQVSWQRKRQAWLSMGWNAICESQCWYLTWAKLQTGIIDSKFFNTICHLQECASRLSCLLNQFLIATYLASKEFLNTVCSQHHLSRYITPCIWIFDNYS